MRPRPSLYYVTGAAASVGLHFLFFGVVTPRLAPERFAACRPAAVFLGAVLSREDIATIGTPAPEGGGVAQIFLQPARDAVPYHVKEPPSAVKPLPALTERPVTSAGGPDGSPPARRPGTPGLQPSLRFYLFEPPAFLGNVDFSDLRKMAEREDVGAEIELAVTLASGGSVRSVRRIVGSGNPILDSFIIFKLQRAVFQVEDSADGETLRLFLRLK